MCHVSTLYLWSALGALMLMEVLCVCCAFGLFWVCCDMDFAWFSDYKMMLNWLFKVSGVILIWVGKILPWSCDGSLDVFRMGVA